MVRLDAKSGGFPVLVLMGAVLAFVCSAEEKVTGISLYPEGHLGWASSLAGGGIKGEVWVSDKGVLDAGELLRQVEIEGGIRVIHSLAEESDSQRLNVIAKLDVLICSDAAWLGLTDSERLAVHERVGKGMGLVLIDLEESKVFDVEKVRWEVVDLPQVLEAEYSMPLREGVRNEVGSWETYGAESGRIAVFQGHFQPDMQKLVPYDFAEEIEPSLLYEYHLASLIRAILWVSQRKSQLSITGIETSDMLHSTRWPISPTHRPKRSWNPQSDRARATIRLRQNHCSPSINGDARSNRIEHRSIQQQNAETNPEQGFVGCKRL